MKPSFNFEYGVKYICVLYGMYSYNLTQSLHNCDAKQ